MESVQVRIISDIARNKGKILESMAKYGHFAEHNFLHYTYCESPGVKNVLLDCGKGRLILMQHDQRKNLWKLFPCGVLAPEDERTGLLLRAADIILKEKKARKLVVEVSEKMRRELLRALSKPNGIKACKYTYTLHWPLYNMDQWDPELKGSRMKKLRNIRNRFYKRNKITVKDSRQVPKETLKKILLDWASRRTMNDHINRAYYQNLIENGFQGIDFAKTIYVNGQPATITAGWRIPNSRNSFSAIGIVDYSCPGLGEIANLEDLAMLKESGFEYVDFGGSDEILLRFKKKFKPETIYKTYTFSIVRSQD